MCFSLDPQQRKGIARRCQQTRDYRLALDETLESLGPYAVEAAVLTGEYENEPCELVVAPTTEAGATALSHPRLDQIKPRHRELSPAFCACCS